MSNDLIDKKIKLAFNINMFVFIDGIIYLMNNALNVKHIGWKSCCLA